ncbi:transcriptional regulator [Enemella evansiae]|uniref:helix-turn-helix domain-containing protein n=1 Tax=Enemella evansiae TaxID=2016499 RepID=UPI000B970CFB|nr:XRE family transcriptional regulator [Enemella evansiae]OYO17988.1 transcriptional regulator [Enemella evansiae]
MSDAVRAVAANLQRERARAGWSISELGRRANVAKSTLSQLEAGSGNPSVETLWALATALGIPFARLVEPATSRVTVVRAGEGQAYASGAGGYLATLLATAAQDSRCDLYRLEVAEGARRESDPHPQGTVEHLLLCSGSALIGPADAPVLLGPGDFISYRGDAPHVFEGRPGGALAMLVSEQR